MPSPSVNPASLPDPFPDYVVCPHCGEPEVEMWCYDTRARCHACGEWIVRPQPICALFKPDCPRLQPPKKDEPAESAGS